jgi:Uma2 family endonuclease
MLLKLKQINVPSGQRVLITDLSWQEFEAVLEDLEEKRSSRIAYDRGTLEIMTPLPEHEINKIFISNFIEIPYNYFH